MSLDLPSNVSNLPSSAENVNPQEPASNVEQNQIQHPGHQASPRCAPPPFTIRAKDANSTPIGEVNWNMFNNTLTLAFKGCDAIVVGNSTTIQHQSICDHCYQGEQMQTNPIDSERVQTASGSKLVDGIITERAEILIKSDCKDTREDSTIREQSLSGKSSTLDAELSLPLIAKQGYLNGPQCERIMEQLEALQDNGKFEQHKRLVNSCLKRIEDVKSSNVGLKRATQQHVRDAKCELLLKKLEVLQSNGKLSKNENLYAMYSRLSRERENADMELSLVIEQALSFMYHKELKKSKLFLTSVIELGSYCQLRNPAILIARANFLLAENYTHRYDKDKKIQALLNCLEHGENLLQLHDSPEDWAELYYNYGSVWLAIMSTIPDDARHAKARKHAGQNARRYYERAIAFSKKDPRLRVQIKKLTYCHLGAAKVLLDCTSTAARVRQKHITPNDMRDAKSHLDFVESVLGDCLPLGSRMHLFKTRSDQYYRQGFYQRAKDTAQDALQIATINGFKTELTTLQERINLLDRFLEENICTTADNEESSNSDNDASSENENMLPLKCVN